MSLEKDSDLPITLNLPELNEQLAQKGKVICPIQGCNQDFKSLWGLKYHLRHANHQEVTERKFKCDQCNLLFQSRVNLRQHRIEDHSGSEGESPLSNPLGSPRLREHGSLPFSSTNTASLKTTKINTEKSCTKERENSIANETRNGQNEEKATPGTSAKRKRGRPKKNFDHATEIDRSEDSHYIYKLTPNGQVEVVSESILPSKNSDGCALDNKSSENSATPRRTSTRVRIPRKDIYVYNDEEIETEPERSKRKEENSTSASNGNIPKKRGRKPKNVSVENVISDSADSPNCSKAPAGKKRGRKRKCETVVVDDENGDVQKDEAENNVDDEDDDDVENDNCEAKKAGDKKAGVAPKKRGRKKQNLTELERLKRLVKSGQRLACENKDCKAKFNSALGYIAHMKICGVKEEEREKFTCEVCDKVYMSFPGLQYHIKAKHTESEPTESSDQQEGNNEEDEAPEILPSGRTRRKAASRAMSKVQKLATQQDLEEVAQSKRKVLKKEDLEKLIARIKGRPVTKEQEEWFTEVLKTQPEIVCPSTDCSNTFKSVDSIKSHLLTCEKAMSYKCLSCGKVYLSTLVIRNHIAYRHVGYRPMGKDKSDSSDVDYKLVSSGESEDDDDEIEIEEIEDSGSDVTEELEDCTEEVFVWDSKRKKFRKPGRPIESRRMACSEIGSKDSDSYRITEEWRKQEHKHEVLFPNFRPSSSYWSSVDTSEVDQYLPEATMSPKFIVRRKGDQKESEHDIQLPLFGSTTKEDSSVYGDVTFNVGGPVWAMDWCPVPDSNDNTDQFLAISTHRSWDEVNNVHKCVSSKGLIQLWNVGKLKLDSACSGCTPTLALAISHNYGAIWDISWCPSGTWEPESTKTNQADVLPRLGVMALACGDGFVRILSIPWPSALLSALDVTDSVIVSPTPHVVLMPCALGVTYNGECGQAWRAKWFPCSMHEKIATGFSDGTVAIWNLLTESPLLKEKVAAGTQTFRLAPFLHITTNSSVVKDLAWSPQFPDYLVTGSYDRNYKIWNLKSPFAPVTVIKRGIPHEVHWPVSFKTIVSCEDDAFQNLKYPCVARYFTLVTTKEERLTILAASHNSTIWTISVSDWAKLLASADAAGEVVGVQLSRKKKRSFPKFSIYRVYLEDLDIDRSQSKGQEPNNMEHSELLGENQIGTCIDKDIEVCTSEEVEEIDAVSFMERDTEASKNVETCPDKEKENATPPQSTAEVFEKQRLVFYDVNALEFHNSISSSDEDFKRLVNPSTMQSIPYDNYVNPQAIHKVRFNPNKQAFTWLASAGAAGLARLHLVKEVKP